MTLVICCIIFAIAAVLCNFLWIAAHIHKHNEELKLAKHALNVGMQEKTNTVAQTISNIIKMQGDIDD